MTCVDDRGSRPNGRREGEVQPPKPFACPQCTEPMAASAVSGTSVRCPQCEAVMSFKTLGAKVGASGHLLRRSRQPGRANFETQQVEGDSFYRATGRWHRLTRVIDRHQDRYYEHITDEETGIVMRHVDEPLSRHRPGRTRGISKKPRS